jgi:hypothetical protein
LTTPRQPLGRSDRHVLRARLRVGSGAPRHRLAFNIEEALRLCALPGEEEGRVYYFRRLFIGALPEDGDRRAWLDAFQRGLLELARNAVHGSEGRAPGADAVFFRNEPEACESLLARIVQRRPADAWFWPAVSGTPAGARPARIVVALIEKLLRAAPSWVAVAAAVFAAIDRGGAGALVRLLPDEAVERWLDELGSEDAALTDVAPIRFTASMRSAMEEAAAELGAEDSRLLWLASLAVVLASPSELARGAVRTRARLVLRTIGRTKPFPVLRRDEEVAAARLMLKKTEWRRPSDIEAAYFDTAPELRPSWNDREGACRPMGMEEWAPARVGLALAVDDAQASLASKAALAISAKPAASSTKREAIGDEGETGGARPITLPDAVAEDRAIHELPGDDLLPGQDGCFGEATEGAGLYFLLNALQYLKTNDDELEPRFLAHFFQRAARHAGIADDDPILLWTLVTMEQAGVGKLDERRLRIWLMKVRRWCWRNGNISLRDVVRRPGRVTLTRTDLDVTLALDSVDIRIRRIGLDLDPGWVPWFGRVVRFHYLARGELHA